MTPPPAILTVLSGALEERWLVFEKLFQAVRQKQTTNRVHDLRIAVRRLIAALSLAEELNSNRAVHRLRRRLRGLLKSAGSLRDVQVMQRLLREMQVGDEPLPGSRRLARSERSFRVELRRRSRGLRLGRLRRDLRLVKSGISAREKSDLAREPSSTLLRVVDRLFGAVVDARRLLDTSDAATIHAMRVAFKKYRYALEVVGPSVATLTPERLGLMQAFQTTMGELHDLDVIGRFLSDRRPRQGDRGRALRSAMDLVAESLLAQTAAFAAMADDIFRFRVVPGSWPDV